MIPSVLKRGTLLFLALASILVAGLSYTNQASAAELTLDERIEKFLYYRAVNDCLRHIDLGKRSATEVANGDYWDGGFLVGDSIDKPIAAALLTGEADSDGPVCRKDDDDFFPDAASALGFDNAAAMYCAIQPNAGRDDDGSGDNAYERCLNGSGGYDTSGSGQEQASQFTDGVKNYATGGSSVPTNPDGAMSYKIYFDTFNAFCKPERVSDYQASRDKALADSKEYVVVNEVVLKDDGNPDIVPALYKVGATRSLPVGSGDNQDYKVFGVWAQPNAGSYDLTCGQLAAKTWDFDEAYGQYLMNNPEEAGTGRGTGSAASSPVCTAGALGWVICPAINFIGEMNDAVYSAVQSMLYIDPVTVKLGGPLYDTWTKFRDVANVLFVVVFMIVVFSQATSVGLSSYGVKRILPRILAAAVLVNVSFFICQIAIDISNIVGVGIGGLVDSMRSGTRLNIDVLSWETAIGAAIAGGGVVAGIGTVLAAGSMTAALAMLLPFAITALFAVVTAIAVLIARQVIIVLLVALAPLAFIAIVLPNTQKYFQLWQNTFTTMLVMFPLVSLLFAGSQLAANIVLTSATSRDGISFFALIAAIGMMFIPLFGIPFIVKFSGGVIGRVANLVNNPNKGPLDALKRRANEYSDYKKDQARARNLDPAIGATGAFAATSRRRARRDDRYARFKDKSARANQRYLSNMYSGENINFDESSVDVSAAGGDPDKERAIIARAKQDAQTRAGERFATQQLGGRRAAHYSGSNLQAELNRARAGAISQENEESRKRSAAIEQLVTHREQGLTLDQTLEMYDDAYREAAAAGDHETATAILRRSYSKGGPGRSQFAQMISKHAINGAEAQKHMEESIYSIANDKRADVVKGSMTSDGVWSLAGASGMSYEQILSLDDKAMYNKLATISQAQADHILNDDNLKSQIQTGAAQAMLKARQQNTIVNPSDRINPADPSSKTWDSLKENTAPGPIGGGTPPPPAGGGGTP